MATMVIGDVNMQGPGFFTTERAPAVGEPSCHHHLSTCKLLGLLGHLQLKLERGKRVERDNPVGKPSSTEEDCGVDRNVVNRGNAEGKPAILLSSIWKIILNQGEVWLWC